MRYITLFMFFFILFFTRENMIMKASGPRINVWCEFAFYSCTHSTIRLFAQWRAVMIIFNTLFKFTTLAQALNDFAN